MCLCLLTFLFPPTTPCRLTRCSHLPTFVADKYRRQNFCWWPLDQNTASGLWLAEGRGRPLQRLQWLVDYQRISACKTSATNVTDVFSCRWQCRRHFSVSVNRGLDTLYTRQHDFYLQLLIYSYLELIVAVKRVNSLLRWQGAGTDNAELSENRQIAIAAIAGRQARWWGWAEMIDGMRVERPSAHGAIHHARRCSVIYRTSASATDAAFRVLCTVSEPVPLLQLSHVLYDCQPVSVTFPSVQLHSRVACNRWRTRVLVH